METHLIMYFYLVRAAGACLALLLAITVLANSSRLKQEDVSLYVLTLVFFFCASLLNLATASPYLPPPKPATLPT